MLWVLEYNGFHYCIRSLGFWVRNFQYGFVQFFRQWKSFWFNICCCSFFNCQTDEINIFLFIYIEILWTIEGAWNYWISLVNYMEWNGMDKRHHSIRALQGQKESLNIGHTSRKIELHTCKISIFLNKYLWKMGSVTILVFKDVYCMAILSYT